MPGTGNGKCSVQPLQNSYILKFIIVYMFAKQGILIQICVYTKIVV